MLKNDNAPSQEGTDREDRSHGAPGVPPPPRHDGFVPIGSYGVLGDGRTVALVAADGQVDWWPVPAIDAPPIFAAVLDPVGGGSFMLRPAAAFTCARRYLPGTNVIESTYTTSTGKVRVIDALNVGGAGCLPWTELARRVEGLDGDVEMTWEVAPGNRFRQAEPLLSDNDDAPIFTVGDQMLAVVVAGTTPNRLGPASVGGHFSARAGQRYLIAVLATDNEPLFISESSDVDDRLDATIEFWQRWSNNVPAEGRWGQAVQRSALALKSLLYEVGGGIAAAATTSLPERVGGGKNYDYRYSWVRDSAFTVDAFLNLDLHEEVHSAVSWMLSALRRSAPKLHVFYTMKGDAPDGQSELDVPGYKYSRPVRSGNAANKQTQLGVYGDLFDMLGHYCDDGHVLDQGSATLLAELADQCCKNWSKKDSGIWELPTVQHYTISKIGCWVALDRARTLARAGHLPDKQLRYWDEQADAVKEWVNEHCWSDAQQAYTFYAGTEDLDAAVLLAGRTGFSRGPRLASTIEAIVKNLGHGPMVYRYTGADQEEGAFIACSFWLVSAMAHNGQKERATALMDQAVAMATDLGLLSEQIDPRNREMLGNIPQGLSHLALINAAHAIERRL